MKNKIGSTILRLRKEKKITQSQLAEYLYVTPQTVSKWEMGNASPDISLVTRIAHFFDISLDELFGVTSLDKTEDLVTRYSICRDDASYEEASKAIAAGIEENASINVEDKCRYEMLKVHLLLQNARKSILDACNLTGILLEEADKEAMLPLILQEYQLKIMNGEIRSTYLESKERFETKHDSDDLFIYLEVLLNLQAYEFLVKIFENDCYIINIVNPITETNIKLWVQYLKALVFLDDRNKIERHLDDIKKVANNQEYFEILLLTSKVYSEDGDNDKIAEVKEEMLDILKKLNYNENIKQVIIEQINRL